MVMTGEVEEEAGGRRQGACNVAWHRTLLVQRKPAPASYLRLRMAGNYRH
jgi:hypothetical protein